MLPRLLLHTQVALIPYDMLNYPALLGVGYVRLAGQYCLQAHDLAVLDEVENEAVVIEYGHRGRGVSLQLPLLSLVNPVVQPIGLYLQLPLLHDLLVYDLLL